MKANIAIFTAIGSFLFVVACAYTFITMNFEPSGIEWVGVPALFALAAFNWMIAVFIWLNARRFGLGASDRDNAEVHEEAGIQGKFAAQSWAPLICAAGGAVAFAGFPIALWITFAGIAIALAGTALWVLEFSVGHHSH